MKGLTMMHLRISTLALALIGLSMAGCAQADASLVRQLQDDERSAIEAVSLYPDEQRNAILEAATEPVVLVKMQSIQKNTEQDFRNLLSGLPEEDQKMLVDLSRYPELVGAMTAEGKRRSGSELDDILSNYPDEVQANARAAHREHFDVMMDMRELYMASDQQFQAVLKGYSPEVQEAYRTLLKSPEVLALLSDNMEMTVLLGDVYEHHPKLVEQELDSLNLVVAEQRSKEVEEWKQGLEDNPEALQEYEAAAKDFAREQGYSEEEINEPVDRTYVREEVVVHHVWRPYVYWFGSPWWYTDPWWYPYPWWYHWGYYYTPAGSIVVVDMPSWHFWHWHFYHPNAYYHFYHYPYFTDHAIRHYHHHRNSPSSLSSSVGGWVAENRPHVPSNFLDDDGKRAIRLKEYGRLEANYAADAQQHPGRTNGMSKRDYLAAHANQYPSLKPALSERPREDVFARPQDPGGKPTREPNKLDRMPQDQRQPVQQPGKPTREPTKLDRIPPDPRQPESPGKPTRTPSKIERFPQDQRQPSDPSGKPREPSKLDRMPQQQREIDRARDYHQNRWEPNKIQRMPQQQPYRAPQMNPKSMPGSNKSPIKNR